jgi:predicted transcriptional regulator
MQAATKRRRPAIDWEQLARAETHPVRIDALELLRIDGGRALSPNEIAYELQLPLSNVSYHVNQLARAGFVEVVAHRDTRGATEHFFCLQGEEDPGLKQRPPFANRPA